ncbi:DUF2784 domain-containing protein [Lichenicoccus sp.]|uniref:DUF2784 domain-containing protein n=1 Tax=Lichenicoccus sp. TaxID=2781899 RepID=UPI003D0D257E
MLLAGLVLGIHAAIIGFNVVGLLVIPLGGWLGWVWVRIFWWRALHVASLAVVAAQALLGRACFLTIWQAELSGTVSGAGTAPMVMDWVDHLIYIPLPIWCFALLYLAVLAGVITLSWLVPPARRHSASRTGPSG